MTLSAEVEEAFSLAGKTAVITGGASGFGLEAARIFAAAGAKLMLADVNVGGLQQALPTLAGTGSQVHILQTDVTERTSVDAVADAARGAFGQVDIWVNSAGLPLVAPILQTSEADAAKLIAVNMMGTSGAARPPLAPCRRPVADVSSTFRPRDRPAPCGRYPSMP